MKNAEIRELADSVLARFFKGTSFKRAEVRTEYAFDGAPYIQVDAHFEHQPKSNIRTHIEAMDAMQVKLFEAEDNRLVAMTIYADDEPLAEGNDGARFAPESGVQHQ